MGHSPSLLKLEEVPFLSSKKKSSWNGLTICKYLANTGDSRMYCICKVWDCLRAQPGHAYPPAAFIDRFVRRTFKTALTITRTHLDDGILLRCKMKRVVTT